MAQKKKATEKNAPHIGGNNRKKGQLVTYFIIFVFGFLAGIAFTVYKGGTPAPSSSPTAEVQSEGADDQTAQAIIKLEAEVTARPENFQNWIRLGDLYYDTNQPEKAIAAYTKSLEYHSGDADLLTDLGVMYRRIKQPEKAIEMFDQAMKKDPTHLPSRFNKGIVLMYDLKDPKGAIAAWEELLKINPKAKTANGQPIREFVDKLKTELAKNK